MFVCSLSIGKPKTTKSSFKFVKTFKCKNKASNYNGIKLFCSSDVECFVKMLYQTYKSYFTFGDSQTFMHTK